VQTLQLATELFWQHFYIILCTSVSAVLIDLGPIVWMPINSWVYASLRFD